MKKSIFKFLTFGFAAFAILSCFSGCNNDLPSGLSNPLITGVSITGSNEIEATGTAELTATVKGEYLDGYEFLYQWETSPNITGLVATISDDKSKTTESKATLSAINISLQSQTVKVKVSVTLVDKDGIAITVPSGNAMVPVEKTSNEFSIIVKGLATTTKTYTIDGKTVVVSSDGSATIENADGTTISATVSTSADGTVTIKNSDGATLYTATTAADGKIDTSSVKDADGKSVKVEEKTIAVENITLDKTEISVEEESSINLTATISPSNATDKTVTWTTSDSKIAIVENGKVTGVKAGNATIIAKAGEKEAKATITVTAKATKGDEDDDNKTETYTVTVWQYGEKISDVITQSNGEIVFTNPSVVTEVSNASHDIWNYCVQIALPTDVKQGKNYKVSADLKADKETDYFEIEAKDDFSTSIGNRAFIDKITTEYANYSITTGTASFDWSTGVLNIAAGTISKLYIKNLKIEEIADVQNFGTHISSADATLYSDLTTTENSSANSLTLNFASANKIDVLGADVALLSKPLDVANLYKVSFNITSNTALSDGEFNIWGHSVDDSYETAGTSHFYLSANTAKEVTMYIPVYQQSDESVRIPYIWISSAKAAKIIVSNVKAEKVDLSNAENELVKSGLWLYYAGTTGDSWSLHDALDEKGILISANSGLCKGQLILSDSDGWNSTENTVTSFKVLASGTGDGLNPEVKTVDGDTNIWFENASDKNVYVEFGFNEKLEVTITKTREEEPTAVDVSELYIKGSFISWEDDTKLTRDTDGTYYYEWIAQSSAGTFAFDIGGWKTTYRGTANGTLYEGFANGETKATLYPYNDKDCMPIKMEPTATYRIIVTGGIDCIECELKKVKDATEVFDSVYKANNLNYVCSNYGNYEITWGEKQPDGSYLGTVTIPAEASNSWGGDNTADIEFGVTDTMAWGTKFTGGTLNTADEYVELTYNASDDNKISGVNPLQNAVTITIKSTSDAIYATYATFSQNETIYTVVYNDAELLEIPESELSYYKFLLTEGTDYTISGTTIILTESGYVKVSKTEPGDEPVENETVTLVFVFENEEVHRESLPLSAFESTEENIVPTLYSDFACTVEITDISTIKAGDTVYVLNDSNE